MKIETRGLCKLCLEEKSLVESHIFPRSYFKSLKHDGGQLINIVADEDTKPRKLNTDPKQHLLCKKCERFFSESYEEYGTRLFKKNDSVSENDKSVTYHNFDYRTFYLYLISILWRTSVSKLEQFAAVKLDEGFNELLRQSLWTRSVKINDAIGIDDFIKIVVLRMIDKSERIEQDAIDKLFIMINGENGPTPKDGLVFYFMIDGHLIIYYLRPVTNLQETRSTRIRGQLINSPSITIPKVDIREIKQIQKSLAWVRKKFEKYGPL
jgi:hypothetical protein